MVTETIPVREQEQEVLPVLGVCEVGEIIGIPIVVRPWWGSRRRLFETLHTKCGGRVYRDYNGWWCFACGRVSAKDVKLTRANPARWVCAAGWRQQLKWPAVQGDKVIMWEGRCGERYAAAQIKRYGSAIHVHRQTLEVLDFSTTAMLVRVSVNNHRLNFLISRDDGWPFVHVVTKSQTTVAAAYDYMVPVPVFNARMHGFHCPRQGDFFFVPREFWGNGCIRAAEKAPAPLPQNGRPENVNWDQNRPYLNVPIQGTRHVAELFIFHIPFDLVKGTVTAPDHPPLQLETWHCAIRNIRPAAAIPDGAGNDD